VNTDRTTSTLPKMVAAMHADITNVAAIISAAGRINVSPKPETAISSVDDAVILPWPTGHLVVVRSEMRNGRDTIETAVVVVGSIL